MRRNPPGVPPKPDALRQRRNKRPMMMVLPDHPPRLTMRPPSGLLPSTRKAWRSYWQSPVSQALDVNADGPVLLRWALLLDELERTWELFRKSRIIRTDTGTVKANPLLSYLQTLFSELSHCEAQLGMTPSGRARLGLTIAETKLTVAELNRGIRKDEAAEVKPWSEALEAQWQAL